MKVHKLAKFAGVAIALGIYFLPSGTTSEKSFVVFAQAADSPCKPPAQITGSVEETAWRIFVAATCPTANPKKYPYVTWEKWIEQEQQYPSAPGAAPKVSELMTVEQRFHRSRLALARTAATALPQGANEGCGPGQGDPSVTICEEVRLNSGPSGTSAYVTQTAPGKTLISRTQQATFAASSPSSKPAINLPPAAVEIKADWIQLPASTCAQMIQQKKVWVEYIGSECYALAGMHLISKLLPNWIWATFEAQYVPTNPQRCVVLGCNDPFGSVPAKTPSNKPGATTAISGKLKALMTSAKLDTVWQNYRLDGVQTEFVDQGGNAILLGNSIIEGENAGVPLKSSSCITCHGVSSIAANGSEKFAQQELGNSPTGKQVTLPADVFSRDFLWSLSEACPDSHFRSCGTAKTAKP